jgi:hypothetical protein
MNSVQAPVFEVDPPESAQNRWTAFDSFTCLVIIALGTMQFALVRHWPQYLYDTNYFELFKSILNHTGYGFDGKPMTQLPPGFPYMLAFLSKLIGPSYIAMLRVGTVFAALALITSYFLLRSQTSKGAAAACCLLLGSGQFLFFFTTTTVFADMPYFFASTILVYTAIRLDRAENWRVVHILTWFLWGFLLVGTVLLKSAGIALIGGLVSWMAMSYFNDPEKGKRLLKFCLPAVIAAAIAAGAWMSWAARHQYHDWQIPGYGENYVAQLRLKNDNDPELGLATWKDVLIRPLKSANDQAATVVGLFTQTYWSSAWYSPVTAVPLILILLGLSYSFREGVGLLEWYFVIYEAMILFWPWELETRFLYPVAPLVFLYGWRGGLLLWRAAQNRPRVVGICGLWLAAAGSLCSVLWGLHVAHPKAQYCIALWVVIAAMAGGVLWSPPSWAQRLTYAVGRSVIGRGSVARWQAFAATAVCCAFLFGLHGQLKIGRANLDPDLTKDDFNYPVINASEWINSNTDPSSVIMARKDYLIYTYTGRKVIWFPPTHDVALLMDGIERHKVQYIFVQYGNDDYWKPTSDDTFQALDRAYPCAFRLVHAGPHNKVFEVIPEGPGEPSVARVIRSTSIAR